MGRLFCIFFACIGVPFTLYISHYAISLMVPFLLRWREWMVRKWIGDVAYKSIRRPLNSFVSFPRINPSSATLNGRLRSVSSHPIQASS